MTVLDGVLSLLSPLGFLTPSVLFAVLMSGAVSGTLALALVATLALIAAVASTSRATALRRVAVLREKSWRVPGRAGVLRQRDPDSAGHARPRAPGALPAAASC
jgi:hypothetical protein